MATNIMKISKEEFSEKVESMAIKDNVEIIDATLNIANTYGIEPETLSKYISDRVKELIRIEAEKKNLIAKDDSAVLPV